jgi:uncharacterized protein (DUF433 family)
MLDRITRDPEGMSVKPCVRGMRDETLPAYLYLEEEDIRQSLAS